MSGKLSTKLKNTLIGALLAGGLASIAMGLGASHGNLIKTHRDLTQIRTELQSYRIERQKYHAKQLKELCQRSNQEFDELKYRLDPNNAP
ncbi:MAG: hypothetical protein KKB21_04380 [Nanoarchaeota archaeon]|nr:hypothetical protein [Nanoarchaeota archaeon]MBU4086783.1 hypothetical protein [Nanoarchaeota archaeon]